MRAELVFDHWRDRDTHQSLAQTGRGVMLAMGPFHGGSIFRCTVDLDIEQEAELRAAIADGATPVFELATRDAAPPGIVTVAAQKIPREVRTVFAHLNTDRAWGILVLLADLDRPVTRPELYRIVGNDLSAADLEKTLHSLAAAGLVATVAGTPADIGNLDTSTLEVTCLGEIALQTMLAFLPCPPDTPLGRVETELLAIEHSSPEQGPVRAAIRDLRERLHRGEI
jgi:hypothetical protein